MNIKPRLDDKIPKSYLYIILGNGKRYESDIEKLKGKRDKISKESREKYDGYRTSAINRLEKIKSGEEVNLYSNKETLHDFTRNSSHVNFENNYVVKINPICMLKTFKNYGRDTYDLYSFTVDNIFYTQEELMKSLKKDNIVEEYILSAYLSLLASNEEYISIRNDLIDYVIASYNDDRPSFADIVARLKGKDWENSSSYNADEYKIKYYREAYDKGFLRLTEDFYTEVTLIFLLKNRMFNLIPQAIEETTEYGKETLKEYSTIYEKNDNIRCIRKLLLENMDNEHCKWLYELIGFKETGYNLKVMDWNEDDREYDTAESHNFKKIEEVKKFIIRNYECDFGKVAKGEINEMYVEDSDGLSYELILEFCE